MFNGIITDLATIIFIEQKKIKLRLSEKFLQQCKIGDSIAIDGICFTIVNISKDIFTVDIAATTWQITAVQYWQINKIVNIEAAMSLENKISGHLLSGHIDGTATCVQKKLLSDNSWQLDFMLNAKELCKYLVNKGSIALSGISLTISNINSTTNIFSVCIIPHTYKITNLKFLQIGDKINVEVDMLSKYIAKYCDNFLKNKV